MAALEGQRFSEVRARLKLLSGVAGYTVPSRVAQMSTAGISPVPFHVPFADSPARL
jgi:hypothetical protein